MRLRITLEGRDYDVAVEVLRETESALDGEALHEELIASLPESVFRPARSSDTGVEDRICRSPMAGLVVSVGAKPSQRVGRSDAVVVIEAMKMQNTIHAPVEGVLEEIHVRPGEAVKSGQPLFRVS